MPLARSIAPAFCTDYALCNALGTTRTEVLSKLALGQSGLGAPTRFALPFETRVGELQELLPPLPQGMERWESRIARLALMLAESIRPGIARATQRWGADRVAVVLGTSTGGLLETEQAYRSASAEKPLPRGYSLLNTHSLSATAELLKEALGLRGPAWMVSTACSSSAKALASAQRLLHAGVVDAVLTGGVDVLSELTLFGFHGLGILSETNCRPFSDTRDGTSLGEGGALLLLERTGDAGVALVGSGETSDAFHLSAPEPEGRGAEQAMRAALLQAGLTPAAIGYINAHGTGTPLNDAAEALAIARVFGKEPWVASTKGYTGHLLGAAGATEAAFCVAALEQGSTPASLGSMPGQSELNIRVSHGATPFLSRYALSNSFAFGGSNISLVFERVQNG